MLAAALLTDAALGRAGLPVHELVQEAPLHRSNTRPTPAPCQVAVVMSADIDFLPAVEMAAHVFACPVVIAFAYPHTGYRLGELAKRVDGLFTEEISEDELRNCMLPNVVVLDGGKKVSIDDFKKSHFQQARARG
jgi:hypothetical protein